MTPILTKSYRAVTAILAHTILAASADNKVTTATSADDLIIGVAGSLDCVVDDMVDVVKLGHSEVRLGDTVAFGDALTSDATGKAIKATPVATDAVRIIGFAEQAGVADDIIIFNVAPSIVTGATI